MFLFLLPERSVWGINQIIEMTVDIQEGITHSHKEFSQNNLNNSELILNIADGGKEFPLEEKDKIIVYFRKPNQQIVYQDEEIKIIDKAKGKIHVPLTTQTIAAAGTVYGEISIERLVNNVKKRLSTNYFSFSVRSSLASNQVLESTNEFQMFDKLLGLGEKLKGVDVDGLIASKETAEAAKEESKKNTSQIEILRKLISEGGSGGNGVLSFETLSELQAIFPTGNNKPVWIVSENSWYYWEDGPPIETTPPIVIATPNGGSFGSAQTVTLAANETATIYYTLDGSMPTVSSAVYKSPISIQSTTTLKFFGKDVAGNSSTVQTVTFTITGQDTTPPIVTTSPSPGTYTSPQTVTLTANEKATIYYTLDGSVPTTNSPVYSVPITVASSVTLKYFAKDNAGNSSSVQASIYTILKETNPGTVIFNDNFNRANSISLGVSDSGHMWKDYASPNGTVTLGVRDGIAYLSGGTWQSALNKFRRFTTIPISTNNFVIEVQTKSLPADSGDSLGICIRMPSIDRDMVYLLKPKVSSPSGKYILAKMPYGGNVTTLGTSNVLVNENDLIKIEHRADGSITVFVNDVLEISATDTLALTETTNVGIGINADVVGLGIDRFKVTSL